MYIKITLSAEIVYADRNLSSLNATIWLTIRPYDCPREHDRLFVSTRVIIKSWNVTPVDDYK